MPENRGKDGRFVAGNSANPGGRPKVPAEVKEALRAACPYAVEYLLSVLQDESEKTKNRMDAANSILDRAYGKPESMSKVELTGENPPTFTFRWMTDENTSTTTPQIAEKKSLTK